MINSLGLREYILWSAGGPGSGKVTHCDTLMEEKRGVTHINMMDLLHQHVISNGMWWIEH